MVLENRKKKEIKPGILGSLAFNKKKTVAAFSLVALMIFMWIRVLTGMGPENAGASSGRAGQIPQGQAKKKVEISYIKLPEIQGRNDHINKDFFSAPDWGQFDSNKNEIEVSVSEVSDKDRLARELSEALNVDAIVSGEDKQVFINGRLLRQGQELVVMTKEGQHICEILAIEGNSLTVGCGNITLKLKVSESVK